MHEMPSMLRKFKLSDPLPVCGRWQEHMPKERNEEIYQIYIKARRLWRSKIEWELTRPEAQRILDDVRFASDRGDWGARAVMADFYRNGLGPLTTNHVLDQDMSKAVELVRMAVGAGQAWGFFGMGIAHEYGYGGVVLDEEIAWAYFLKGAELGSPDAQMALADAYSNAKLFEKENAMLMCAFKQGHGAAAYQLGQIGLVEENFEKAVRFYQDGVKFGSKECAAALELLFLPDGSEVRETRRTKMRRSIGAELDPERSKRYNEIYAALEIDPDLRLGKLDDVLPLPPAPLPRWESFLDAIDPRTDARVGY
jgi:TPR repeat protein